MLFIPAICIAEELWVTFSHLIYTCYLDRRVTLSYIWSCYLYLLYVSQRNFELHLVMLPILLPGSQRNFELHLVMLFIPANLDHRGTLSYILSCRLYLLSVSQRNFELHLVMIFVPAIWITEELWVIFSHVIYTCYLYQGGTLSYM